VIWRIDVEIPDAPRRRQWIRYSARRGRRARHLAGRWWAHPRRRSRRRFARRRRSTRWRQRRWRKGWRIRDALGHHGSGNTEEGDLISWGVRQRMVTADRASSTRPPSQRFQRPAPLLGTHVQGSWHVGINHRQQRRVRRSPNSWCCGVSRYEDWEAMGFPTAAWRPRAWSTTSDAGGS